MEFVAAIAGAGSALLSYLVPFLFVLSVVVFFHELGHFAVARLFSTRVDVFSLGFGGEIFGWYDKHGTRWRVSWLPLGGYVKFFGDDNAASTPDREALEEQSKSLSPSERAACFHFKPLHQRVAIVAAGPIANFILSIVIFTMIFSVFGEVIITPRVDAIRPGSAAEEAGLAVGDVIVAVDGANIDTFNDLQRIVSLSANTPLRLTVRRDDQLIDLMATPRRDEIVDQLGNVMRVGLLGVERDPPRINFVEPGSAADDAGFTVGDLIVTINGREVGTYTRLLAFVRESGDIPLNVVVERGDETVNLTAVPRRGMITDESGNLISAGILGVEEPSREDGPQLVRYNPAVAAWKGVQETWFVIDRTFRYLGRLLSGREEADQLGGPLRIAQMSGQVATLGFVPLINLTAILSVSIGLINLFPIPMLDGGHLLYYGYEAAAGRPLTERAQEYGFRIGLALVLCVMVFATWNDLVRLPLLNGLHGLLY